MDLQTQISDAIENLAQRLLAMDENRPIVTSGLPVVRYVELNGPEAARQQARL